MKTISIAVSQWPSLAFAVPYHVAMEKGYFEDEGINIEEVIAGSGGGTTVRSVLAGDLAFGEVATSALVESQDAGSTLVAVGGGSQQVGEVVWVAPQNSSLESIEDLAGKNVGYTNPGSVTESALAIALDRAGVDASTLEQRATGGVSEGLTAMEGGAVDATIHSDPLYAAQDDKYKLLWRSTDYITNYQQTIIVTSPTLVEEDPSSSLASSQPVPGRSSSWRPTLRSQPRSGPKKVRSLSMRLSKQ
ncbi:ABC transporter substrate-binding protein [Arthrobacter crystallopoietes]|nr:ABC transporter substrate-binding protein [Arthrobacter crystallopoietes]